MQILIVDDHTVVRQGLKELLADAYPRAQFLEAANTTDALACVMKDEVALMILDVTLPGKSGLEALPDFRKARPEMPVVMLSMHPEADFALRVIQAGARAYVTKRMADEKLLDAVRKVMSGGRYITPSLAEQLAQTVTRETAGDPHQALSAREFQVLRRLAKGEAVKAIAATRALSPKTVSTYRARILEKRALESSGDLAHYALERGLIE